MCGNASRSPRLYHSLFLFSLMCTISMCCCNPRCIIVITITHTPKWWLYTDWPVVVAAGWDSCWRLYSHLKIFLHPLTVMNVGMNTPAPRCSLQDSFVSASASWCSVKLLCVSSISSLDWHSLEFIINCNKTKYSLTLKSSESLWSDIYLCMARGLQWLLQ